LARRQPLCARGLVLLVTLVGTTRAEVQTAGIHARAMVLDGQSTTGPTPPRGVEVSGLEGTSPDAVTISGVPAYEWRHGCGPTAAGMVIGYWDEHGFGQLVDGDASSQTSAVNAMIATEGPASNYTDYCIPVDSPPELRPDKSEDPPGDEHAHECVADFMRTSQSRSLNYYGWSWFSDVGRAVRDYVRLAGSGQYAALVDGLYSGSSLTWDVFRTEIDAGRPLVLLVDTGGDGLTDHFVTAVGYDEAASVPYYGCLNTWDSRIHWFQFAPMAAGQPWGVFGGVMLRLIHLSEHVYCPAVLRGYVDVY
jgi:hypothetical protein